MSYRQFLEDRVNAGKLNPDVVPFLLRLHKRRNEERIRLAIRLFVVAAVAATIARVWLSS